MALDFPPSPALNEIYTYGGRSWKWNGTAWDVYSSSTSGNTGATGPQGNTGATGTNGTNGTNGATGPQGNTGATGSTPTNYVASFNGLTGAVTGVSSIRGLTGNVGITNGTGIGLSVSGQTMTFSNTGVLSIDGGTGAIANVARTNVNNTFSVGQSITGNLDIEGDISLYGTALSHFINISSSTDKITFIDDFTGNALDLYGGGNFNNQVISFPSSTTTLAGLAVTQTFTGTNTFNARTNFASGISAAGGVTLAGTLQGTTSSFTGLVSSTVGFSGPGTNITGLVSSFNGLTGAVTGVTVGGTNVFTALNSFNAGISAAGGTFSSQTRFLAGITVAGGATFGTDISVFGVKVGRGNQGATNGGDTNLAVGANTLNVVVPNPASFLGIYNLAFGTSALQNTTSGGYNSAFGTEALLTNTSGYGNIAFGVHVLRLNTTGVENCAFGGGPMYQNTTGGYNVSIGSLSYYYKSTGSYNVAIGYQAGYNYGTPGSGNAVTSATNCTLIGTYATPLTSGTTNEIVIGYNAIGNGSNTVVLGNSSITSTDLRGVVNNPSGLSAAGATFSSNVSVGGNLTVTGTIVGNQGINAQTGTTYSLVLSDSGKLVTLNNVSGITMTFPTYASVGITTGAVVYFAQLGAGTVGFTGAAGVSVRTTPGLFLRTQYSTASAIKIATNEWLVSGDMTA